MSSGTGYEGPRLEPFDADNFNDENGKPAGGHVRGEGLRIDWQNGPLGRGDDRKEPSGAFVETVIQAVIQRIEYYQEGEFANTYNEEALISLRVAAGALAARVRDREAREVQGTHVA